MEKLHTHEFFEEVNRTQKNREVFGWLMVDWFSKRELSLIAAGMLEYDIELWRFRYKEEYQIKKKTYKIDKTISKFVTKIMDFLEEKIVERIKTRKSKKGKIHDYPSRKRRLRVNLWKIFAEYLSMCPKLEKEHYEILSSFFHKLLIEEEIRNFIASFYDPNEGIYSFFKDVFEFFIILIEFYEKHEGKEELDNIIFPIHAINAIFEIFDEISDIKEIAYIMYDVLRIPKNTLIFSPLRPYSSSERKIFLFLELLEPMREEDFS